MATRCAPADVSGLGDGSLEICEGPAAAVRRGVRRPKPQPCTTQDHEVKTRGLIRTSLQPDGTIHTRMLTGLTVTTRPEPLPGHAPGEGYGRREPS
jgi:hypothetical protein